MCGDTGAVIDLLRLRSTRRLTSGASVGLVDKTGFARCNAPFPFHKMARGQRRIKRPDR